MKLPFRTLIFWLHLAAGLIAGSIVLIMSVTGVLLMYEQQIIEWAERDLRPATPPPGTARLGVEQLLAAAAVQPGASPTAVTVKADPEAPVQVSLGRERSVFVDPFTGRVLGEGSKRVREVMHVVTDWHRWLGVEGEGRDTARKITGACNLAFLFLVVSGFYLWVPRRWTRRQVRNVAWFRGGLSGKARDFNWHNTIGLWVFVPLFVVVLSAVFISYPWAGDLLYRALGEKVEPRREGGPGGPPGGRGGEAAELDLTGLNGLWAQAEQRVPGWQTITLRLPRSADAPVAFTILSGGRGRPDLRAQLSFDRATGEVASWQPYASQSTGRKVRAWMRWLHTGEAGGFLGQTLAGLASAGAAVLVWTGLALSWRRFFSKAKNREPLTQPAASEVFNRFEGVDHEKDRQEAPDVA
jgi:uncharacterized iron-regulated membrane protein